MAKTIVVVDDEKLVVCGICSLLSDAASGFTVTATGSSGEEGLKICMENRPDLLLTDIEMPGMGGLELIKKVKQTHPEIKIVVLSCHDEYNYVHRAFLLGADDYILKKDIDSENLNRLLISLLPEEAQGVVSGRKTMTLRLLSKAHDLKPENPGSLGLIGFKSDSLNEDSELSWQPDIPMLQQLISDEISPFGEYFLGQKNDLVIYFPALHVREQALIDNLLNRLRHSAAKYINHTVFVAKYIMKSGESLVDAYNQGITILKGMFYLGSSSILTEAPASLPRNSNLSFDLTKVDLDSGWHLALEDFLEQAEKNRIDPDKVKSELNFAIKHLLHHIEENSDFCSDQPLPATNAFCYQTLLNFNDINLLKKWTLDFLDRIFDELGERRNRSNAVSNAKLYVNTHLDGDLRLVTVASLLSVNSNHLSTIFKRITGQTYIEYVNTRRIQHACEMLRTTDLSAKEIAFQCGYENPNYFSRVFKKTMKTTISKFRCERTCNL